MLEKLVRFIKYNNAAPIAFTIIFLGAGTTFAYNADAIVSTEEKAISVDNSFLLGADLENFNFNLQIKSVTEDENNYYVAYTYRTIAIKDYVWMIVKEERVLSVSHEALQNHYLKDLGLYVTKEIGDTLTAELEYLKRVKTLEGENGLTAKVIATEYRGLIGKHFNTREKTFPGYAAVIMSTEMAVENVKKLSPEEEAELTREIINERKRVADEERKVEEERRLKEEERRLVEEEKKRIREEEEERRRIEEEAKEEPTPTPAPAPIPQPTPTPAPVPAPAPVSTSTPIETGTSTEPIITEPAATTTPQAEPEPTPEPAAYPEPEITP